MTGLGATIGSERLVLGAMAAAAAAFAGALVSQYGFGLEPCPLCIWQRWPYGVGLGLAAGALASAGGLRQALLYAAGAAFLVGAGLGVFHSGVEFGWWKGLASCSGLDPSGMSVEQLREALGAATPRRCDEREPFFLWLSMANWNVLVSIAVAVGFIAAAARARRQAAARGAGC